jgi:hypothetical protein
MLSSDYCLSLRWRYTIAIITTKSAAIIPIALLGGLLHHPEKSGFVFPYGSYSRRHPSRMFSIAAAVWMSTLSVN